MEGKILANGALRKAKRQSVELYGCPVNLYERPQKRRCSVNALKALPPTGCRGRKIPRRGRKFPRRGRKFPRRPVFTARRTAENRCYVKKFTNDVSFFTNDVSFFT